MKKQTQPTPEVRPGWGVVEASSPELRSTLEWLVGELNKPEALAEFRGEAPSGRIYCQIHGLLHNRYAGPADVESWDLGGGRDYLPFDWKPRYRTYEDASGKIGVVDGWSGLRWLYETIAEARLAQMAAQSAWWTEAAEEEL